MTFSANDINENKTQRKFFMIERKGKRTLVFSERPSVKGFASVAGDKEAQGPLGSFFDEIIYDPYAGQKTWEQAESALQKKVVNLALEKANTDAKDVDFIFAGDLLNQCISSSFGLRDYHIPYLGQYGACSTSVQGLIMSALTVESNAAKTAACVTSSHFCTAERQYRFPLEYGGQRTPTAQWTVTAAGSCIVSSHDENSPCIAAATVGTIVDMGIKDANNMGAAMAPAAAQTIKEYLEDTKTYPGDYDFIFTGDLGETGSALLYDILKKEKIDVTKNHRDCGMMIYDLEKQDVHAGGSGCGCCASILCSYILQKLKSREFKNVLVIATGALMSPTSTQQGESIPSIAHLVNLRA